ncbi:MAG: hypothetical protein JSV88_27300, partial [Candidatus Aminicenantes bacterium]
MKGKKVKYVFTAVALFSILSGSCLMADVDIFGYFENRFFLLNHLDMSWKNLNDKFSLGDYNRLRLKYQASPSEKVTVNVAVDFFSFHGIMTSPLGTYGDPAGTGSETSKVKIDVDRAYVDLYFKGFDISIGKQRVAMGVSYLWAPLDIFNRVNIFEPKEEKPGANALKVYIPLGTYSGITGVFSPENDFSSSKSGLRAQTHALGIDMALTVIRSGPVDTSIYGLDLRGENFIGWWIEAGYFDSPGRKDKKIVLGFDYTFPLKQGLYWLNEFYYDSSGEKDSANYDLDLLLSGERFTLGQKYFFSMLRFSFTDFISAAFSYIGNWGDGSYILNPMVQCDISQDIMVSLGLY